MSNSLVGPYDTNADEANNHGGPKRMKAPMKSRVDGTFTSPYDTSGHEAKGHDNGLDESTKEGTMSEENRGKDVKHW